MANVNKKRQQVQKPTGNKQGKQGSVNNFKPFNDRRGGKQQRRDEEIADTARKAVQQDEKVDVSESNPLQYYTKFTRFAEDAARLPFSLPLGAPVVANYGEQELKYTVPGVMRLVFTPTIGVSTDFTSPINRSSTRFYTYLRANQKASAAYDHQDITMMELSLDSAYMFHAMCARIYKTANAVTPVNEYYVRALLAAQGVSLADVSANMQDFRGWINTFGYNLGQFSMPAGITLFDRHRWMCDNYYTDGVSSRAQTYIFVPKGFWKYDNTVATGSQLSLLPYMNTATSGGKLQYTVKELMEMGNSLLNAIAGDEDFQYIAGDIYNFYGGDVYSVPYVQENDLLVPTYDETVLSQIENAVLVGDWTTAPVISQNPGVNQGAIIFDPLPSTVGLTERVPMNFHWESPNSGQVIEASRLMVSFNIVDNVSHIQSCGTEVVNWLDIFAINPATLAPRFYSISSVVTNITPTTTFAQHKNIYTTITMLAQFDWAPQVLLVNIEDVSSVQWIGQTWDVENYQLIDNRYLEMIHEACLWSLFEVGTNRVELTDSPKKQ